ncbi:hypothetical protein [Lentzea sp. NPDC059081]|uniref:hypothetical protein n=1 Tax=Lentzea sp. NPDC059081 TaxID=3346719 RepID=UPI00369F9C75
MNTRQALHVIGTAELATLLLMLLNIVTIHHPTISGILGPTHGMAYTGAFITAVLAANGRKQVWLRALVPGIGGLLAARALPAPRTPGVPS